jgi:hypothetical protein
MRTCRFCGAPADSMEDAWPKWLTTHFASDQPATAQFERRGQVLPSWKQLRPELTVRCVCESCNNGWMSDLENETKPWLEPMLRGERTLLDLTSQARLTLWLVKTAMVLEAIDPLPLRGYTDAECSALRTVSAVPYRTSVWVSFATDSTFLFSSKTRHLADETTARITGIATTLGFGHFAAQVFTIRVPDHVAGTMSVTANARRGPWDQATVRIWPNQAATEPWPPAVGLDGEAGLDALATRFSVSDASETEVAALAV